MASELHKKTTSFSEELALYSVNDMTMLCGMVLNQWQKQQHKIVGSNESNERCVHINFSETWNREQM